MKNKMTKLPVFLLLLTFFFQFSTVVAQVPDAINFQAIARDSDGEVMANTNIQLRLTILEGAADGTEVYQELRALTTNDYGSFSFQIGRDANYITVGTFDEIDWAGNSKFLKIDYDPTNTFTFDLSLGTIEFVSVPYAFAAGDVTYIDLTGVQNGDVLVYNETTGKFEPGQVAGGDVDWADIQNTPNFATVATTGDYNDLTNTPSIPTIPENVSEFTNDAGYLTEYNETDPEFTAWDKDYNDLINLPTLFDGDYNSLSNTPVLISDFTMDASAANITNLADPVNAQDAATKAYVDELISLFEGNGMVVVDFTADNTDISLGNAVIFTDNSVLEATSWQWDFGDGNTSTEQNPTHTYTAEGTYTVILTASNGVLSATETKTDYLTVTDGPTYGTFTDSRDGTEYQTITIGSQEWMAENLKYLPSVVGSTTGSETTAYYYVYGYDGTNVADAKATANYNIYGVLYNWPAAMDGEASSSANPSGVQGVCPTGWHLPSDDEWKELEMALGMSQAEADDTGLRGTNEGSKLAGNASLWNSGDLENNAEFGSSGFTALPGGSRYVGGNFDFVGYYGLWWSATEDSTSGAWDRLLHYYHSYVYRSYANKELGFSVRCLRD
jgi:uncharacterized protein (TIGR02145 family)